MCLDTADEHFRFEALDWQNGPLAELEFRSADL